MNPQEQLRQDIENLIGRYASQVLNNENVDMVYEIRALITRERQKAQEDILKEIKARVSGYEINTFPNTPDGE